MPRSPVTEPESMPPVPELETERLLLRSFSPKDAGRVRELAAAREIAATTLNIPHPYEEGMAEAWISTHEDAYEAGEAVHYAITRKLQGDLIGAIGLGIERAHQRAEMGYWIGVPYWSKGFCTEAASAILRYGFETLGLHRIYAHHMISNPASGRVMQKIGMIHEGCLRQHVLKWGIHHDLEIYGMTQTDV